jgi:predicted metal-binding protein
MLMKANEGKEVIFISQCITLQQSYYIWANNDYIKEMLKKSHVLLILQY